MGSFPFPLSKQGQCNPLTTPLPALYLEINVSERMFLTQSPQATPEGTDGPSSGKIHSCLEMSGYARKNKIRRQFDSHPAVSLRTRPQQTAFRRPEWRQYSEMLGNKRDTKNFRTQPPLPPRQEPSARKCPDMPAINKIRPRPDSHPIVSPACRGGFQTRPHTRPQRAACPGLTVGNARK